MGITLRGITQERLKYLHDTAGLSWAQIAATDECAGIPEGTLSSIYNGVRRCPKKWKLRVWSSLWDLSARDVLWLLENRMEV